MAMRLRLGLILGLLGSVGCSGSIGPTNGPVDPRAAEVLRAHWDALKRHDWKAAYARLHPELKAARFTLKNFTDLHTRRRGMECLHPDILITGSERVGDDVVVSFDLLVIPHGGGEQVSVPPRRKATLRKSQG